MKRCLRPGLVSALLVLVGTGAANFNLTSAFAIKAGPAEVQCTGKCEACRKAKSKATGRGTA